MEKKALFSALVLTALVSLLLTLTANSGAVFSENKNNIDQENSLVKSIVNLYESIYTAAEQKVNTSSALSKLKKALECINVARFECARRNIDSAWSTLSKARVESSTGELLKAATSLLVLSIPIALWLGIPRLYIFLWVKTHRHWILEEYGSRLEEVARNKTHKKLLEVYYGVERGEVTLKDPNPPRDFVEYLSRLDYILWFWAALILSLLGLLSSLIDSPLLDPLKLVFGLIYGLFLIGYSITEALYPRKRELTSLEHLALSIGLSLAFLPLVGITLNFAPWGVRREPIALTIFLIIIVSLLVASYRKYELEARRPPLTAS